ncbi:MAG: chloride channel protein [Armatimonadota bacterium]
MKRYIRSITDDNSQARALLSEQSTLFASVLKWSVLASITGIIVGGATSLFLYLLGIFIRLGGQSTKGHAFLLLPVMMPIVVFIIRKLAPSAEGHGTEKVIEAIHTRDGATDIKVVPVKLFTTLLTLGAGGSVGKEGPAAQIGAGLAYSFAKLIQLNRIDGKRLVICGISAGFAAVFGTPISGALFGAEVLYLGLLKYDVMFPCLVSGVVAHIVCRAGSSVPARLIIPEVLNRSHSESVLIALVSGVCFGAVALATIQLLKLGEVLKGKMRLSPELSGLIGGVLLIGIFFLSPQSAGLGTSLLNSIFSGGDVPAFTAFWKIVATSVTLGFGGSGGIITPLFVIGGTSGYALAHLLGISTVLLGAFGMVAVVAAGAGTPIAASVMALELFGPEIGTYAAIACCTAYLIVGHRSVYPSQILGATKSSSIELTEPNARVDEALELDILPRRHSLISLLGKIFGRKHGSKTRRG